MILIFTTSELQMEGANPIVLRCRFKACWFMASLTVELTTIIGAILFKGVATIARLRKRDFQPANEIPQIYDQKPFALDGRIDLDVSFGEKTMRTAVYIKMDAHDQLLLSEGMCRQFRIITYHPDVQRWQGGWCKTPTAGAEETKVPSI